MKQTVGGKGVHNKTLRSKKGKLHGFENTISLTIPSMSTVYFKVPEPKAEKPETTRRKSTAEKAEKKTVAKKATTRKTAKNSQKTE